ncbi:MAG: alkaline phosphatase family protein [Verrucomicrobia bacterium]|nr:alkaline phosphatase family protein [Verrucomicrobiota bacterium]
MINAASLQALEKAQWTSHFLRPLYDGYAFSSIPHTVEKLLTGNSGQSLPLDALGGQEETYDCVIVLLIDGFGWDFFQGYASKYPFLQKGIASKISSQFPSTTAAHITTIHTGLEVGQTGIYEWFYYEPLIDGMGSPLLYSRAGDHVPATLLKENLDPKKVFPFETLYQKLAKQGVKSFVMQDQGIAHSPYSKTLLAGAENLPFEEFEEGLDRVVEICKKPKSVPTYCYLYFGEIDSMCHRHGMTSSQVEDAIERCWRAVETRLWEPLVATSPQKVALIVTADHGMAPVDPKKTVYLNRLLPDIAKTFKTNSQGKPLVPAGSCRDFFLHIEETHLTETEGALTKALEGIADVYPVEKLIQEGFFGKWPVSNRFLERVGNLVILPHFGESVWWWEKHRFEQHFYGAHGGLTPHEMESMVLFHTI